MQNNQSANDRRIPSILLMRQERMVAAAMIAASITEVRDGKVDSLQKERNHAQP